MYRTIEVSDSDEIVIKIPKEYVNKNLEIYVLPVNKDEYSAASEKRDLYDEYYRDVGYK
ncbi:MAG: hypothetical protein HZB41_11215 [Ignavibacteriae bacterium]|nr:hypothetical protein [Ignavibacteriota bacterium]